MSSKLTKNLVELERDQVLSEIKDRLSQGENPLKIFEECKQAMDLVGEKYKNKEYFLAELMLSGDLFKEATELIEPFLGELKAEKDIKGKIILATIQGDIHDLGKNIFGMLLKLEGFEVYDLGVDVNPDVVIEKVKEIQPDFLGFSSLLTITFDPMKEVINKLQEAGLRDKLKILVGGGITTSLVKDYVGADFQTVDAMEGVQFCLETIKARVVIRARGGDLKMKEEYMTPQERMNAAINLEKPDRVPIAPIVGMDLPATYYGLNIAELHREPIKAIEAMVKFFDEFGGWDGYSTLPLIKIGYILGGLKFKAPGQELPDAPGYYGQFDEGEWMKVEDYKIIADIGWGKFVSDEYIYRISDWTPEDVVEYRKKYFEFALKGGEEYTIKRKMGMRTGANRVHPFFLLSLNRSLLKFTQDLYYRPELVEAALDTMTDGLIKSTIAQCKGNGGNVVFIPEERAEGAIYPLKIFERFWWPYTKRIVESLYDEGIISWLHLDQCWDLNIPYFKDLPRASCIIDLDGLTDIFRAKEILKDHLCIMSDVSGSLFSIGSQKQVEDYVKKLIDKLGVDGGHILSSGCEVPPNCKPENFKAFLKTGKTYQLSKE